MDGKLKSTIDKIVKLSQQRPDFDTALRAALYPQPALPAVSPAGNVRLDQIYEYCIQRVVRKQAEGFYKDFPLTDAVDGLVNDYCRMEAFRRRDNFGDFCLSVYQQIERVTNILCRDKSLNEVAAKMWAYPAYVAWGRGITPNFANRVGSYTIADLVFVRRGRGDGIPLYELYAMNKIRAIMYFIGYGAVMKSSDFDAWKEMTNLLNDIYQCRNFNHRGAELYEWQNAVIDRVMPLKSVCYMKFLGALTQYMEYIKNGLPKLSALHEYSLTLLDKAYMERLQPPTILGKIDLPW